LKVISINEYYCEELAVLFQTRIEKHPDTIRELNSPISRPREKKKVLSSCERGDGTSSSTTTKRKHVPRQKEDGAAYQSERILQKRRGEGERKSDEGTEKGEEEMLWKNITCWTAKERELRKHGGENERHEREGERERERDRYE